MKIRILLFNLCGLLLIYFLPEISGFSNIPLYLFEPMRVIVIIALIHTSKQNTYFLVVLLPVLSYLFSNHPSIIKTTIVSGELLLNIFLYFNLLAKLKTNKFLLMSISIVVSKIAYYLMKYLLMQFSLLTGELIATPLYIQISIVVILSGYVYLVDKIALTNPKP